MTHPSQLPQAQPAPKKKWGAGKIALVVVAAVFAFCAFGTIVVALVGGGGEDPQAGSDRVAEQPSRDTAAPTTVAEEPEPAEQEPEEQEPDLTVSQQQAVQAAESYLSTLGGFSRKGLIDQLVFEDFSEEDAEFAVDYLDVDWMEQAEIAAQNYLDTVGGFSRQSLIDQLMFEGFTQEEAEHGADSVGL